MLWWRKKRTQRGRGEVFCRGLVVRGRLGGFALLGACPTLAGRGEGVGCGFFTLLKEKDRFVKNDVVLVEGEVEFFEGEVVLFEAKEGVDLFLFREFEEPFFPGKDLLDPGGILIDVEVGLGQEVGEGCLFGVFGEEVIVGAEFFVFFGVEGVEDAQFAEGFVVIGEIDLDGEGRSAGELGERGGREGELSGEAEGARGFDLRG